MNMICTQVALQKGELKEILSSKIQIAVQAERGDPYSMALEAHLAKFLLKVS